MFTRIKNAFLIVLLLLAFTAPALAQDDDPTPEPEPIEEAVPVVEVEPDQQADPTQEVGLSLDSVVALLIFLLGFFTLLGGSAGTLISTLTDIIKSTGMIPDGWAALPLLALNFIGIVVLYVFFGLTPGDAIPADLDATLQQLTSFIATAITLASSLGFGKLFHDKVLVKLSKRFSHTQMRGLAYPK